MVKDEAWIFGVSNRQNQGVIHSDGEKQRVSGHVGFELSAEYLNGGIKQAVKKLGSELGSHYIPKWQY